MSLRSRAGRAPSKSIPVRPTFGGGATCARIVGVLWVACLFSCSGPSSRREVLDLSEGGGGGTAGGESVSSDSTSGTGATSNGSSSAPNSRGPSGIDAHDVSDSGSRHDDSVATGPDDLGNPERDRVGDPDRRDVRPPRVRDPIYDALDDPLDEEIDPGAPRSFRTVDDFLRGLRSYEPVRSQALDALRRAPAALIPKIIEHVGDPSASTVFEIDAPAFHDEIVKMEELEEGGSLFIYHVRGLGEFALDDISVGPLGRAGGAQRVRARKFREPFSIGVVLRATMLQRIRSSRYPKIDDKGGRDQLLRWWRRYYELNRDAL